mgnify:CR=1 FL=1
MRETLTTYLKSLHSLSKNVALIIVMVVGLPLVSIWEIVKRKEFIFLTIGLIIGYFYGSI